jgi:hypothetical protein
MVKKVISIIGCMFIMAIAQAQDTSLLKLLEDSANLQAKGTVTGTFKATQIINTPTVEAPARKSLQFMIMHRFGKLNEGAYALFGLDNASIRFALDYGITDNFSIGMGRSSFDKLYDGSVKWRLVQQKQKGFPATVSLYSLIAHTTLKQPDKPFLNSKYRTLYTSQLLIARKLSTNLSLQLTPSWTHFNLVPAPQDQNDVWAIGVGGRMKITKRISINAEYNYLPDDQVVSTVVHNSLSAGMDIETGGHVFQLVFTNSQGMVAPYYLTKTAGSWGDGDIYFGFNITRIFNWKK